MMDIDKTIPMRIEARKAEAHLKSLLEYFVDERGTFNEMNEKIESFLKWLWDESPIA